MRLADCGHLRTSQAFCLCELLFLARFLLLQTSSAGVVLQQHAACLRRPRWPSCHRESLYTHLVSYAWLLPTMEKMCIESVPSKSA